MRIANIITDEKIKLDKKFNISQSLGDMIEDIPTLIIGIDNVKKLGKEFNYLDRKIDDKTYWTFNKKEKRALFEEDLFYFIEHAYNILIKDIKFNFVDVILLEGLEVVDIFKSIDKDKKTITFIKNNMVYVFSNKTIYGFDLRQIVFIGKNKITFLDKIKAMSSVFLSDEQILIEYKNELSMFNDEVKYVPLIYSIRNNE